MATCHGALPMAAASAVLPDGRSMIGLGLGEPGQTLSVLCLGAHSDDLLLFTSLSNFGVAARYA
jgi:hypothetical protein